MTINGSIENGIINVSVVGRLDTANAFVAEQHFLKYAESGNTFVIDFAGVEMITSAGIRALLTLYRTVSETGGSVTIKNANESVVSVLEETQFLELFNVK